MIRVTRHGKVLHIETNNGEMWIPEELVRDSKCRLEMRILYDLADYLEKRPVAAPADGAVLTNPYTGQPRDYRDVESDPAGTLIVEPGKPLKAASTPAAPEAVAYLDIGAGGYLDLGSNLPEVQLLALPKGRHALGIIGTYGIDGYVAAPVAAAQEAVTWLSKDDAQLALFQAIQAIKLGNPTDDKMILANLREAGLWIGRYAAAPVAAALIEQPSTSTPAALGIDLEQFREAVENLEWQNRGHANPDFPTGDPEKHAECLRLLTLIDASPKGDIDPLCAAKRPGCNYPACGCADASPKGGSDACIWTDDGEGNWATACGEIFTLIEGVPAENKVHHCPYCGKNLQATSAEVGS